MNNKLQVGTLLHLAVNKGWRNAQVLAVLDDQALVEYVMPSNRSASVTTALVVLNQAEPYQLIRTYSYKRLPKRWITAMILQGTRTWLGWAQRGAVPFPEIAEYLGCQHEAYEDCLICTECGFCRESVDSDDLCTECGGQDES